MDETSLLKTANYIADSGSLHSHHLGQKLMCEMQVISAGAVVRGQNPAATACFDAVNSIASH
jgi:hypothetical protein